MTFQLDTSGRVRAMANAPHAANWYCWTDLTPFQQGYIEAMFASAVGPDGAMLMPRSAERRGILRERREVGFSDLAPATLGRIIADCARFAEKHPDFLRLYSENPGREFWLRRQIGAWSMSFPPLVVSLGDDGLVYLTEGVKP